MERATPQFLIKRLDIRFERCVVADTPLTRLRGLLGRGVAESSTAIVRTGVDPAKFTSFDQIVQGALSLGAAAFEDVLTGDALHALTSAGGVLIIMGLGRLKPSSLTPDVTIRQVQKDIIAAKEIAR